MLVPGFPQSMGALLAGLVPAEAGSARLRLPSFVSMRCVAPEVMIRGQRTLMWGLMAVCRPHNPWTLGGGKGARGTLHCRWRAQHNTRNLGAVTN